MPSPAASRAVCQRLMLALVALGVLTSCGGEGKPVEPLVATANVRPDRVIFTQVVQDMDGSLPLIAGAPAVAKVLVVRSRESVTEVPVVLRLFRGGRLIHTDTARTGGVLGPSTSFAAASAEFLVPGALVAADVAWQIALDPAQTVADSTRDDNLLPAVTPAALQVVSVPAIRLRLVPVILTQHDDATGDVTAAVAEQYVRIAHQVFPARSFTVAIGSPVRSAAYFGAPPVGGDRGFWGAVLADVDRARVESNSGDELWYGVVMLPVGYSRPTFGGFAYIPSDPAAIGPASRTSVGLGIGNGIQLQASQALLAHEMGHNFGRLHAPGCGAPAPLDSLYPGTTGAIFGIGHDVWAWANGQARGAQSVGSETADVMSYCQPVWVGPHTHREVTRWRMGGGIVARRASVDTPVVTP